MASCPQGCPCAGTRENLPDLLLLLLCSQRPAEPPPWCIFDIVACSLLSAFHLPRLDPSSWRWGPHLFISRCPHLQDRSLLQVHYNPRVPSLLRTQCPSTGPDARGACSRGSRENTGQQMEEDGAAGQWDLGC